MANFSTGLRNTMLSTACFRDAFYGAKLRIFTGPVPDNADAAETGTLLLEITNEDDPSAGLGFGGSVNGVISKDANVVWTTPAVLASGGMAYFRLVSGGDMNGATSNLAPRIQGTVGIVGADLVVTSTSVEAGQPWTLNYFSVSLPNPA